MPLTTVKHCQFCLKAFPTQRAINQHISASKICLKEWHKKITRKNVNLSPKRRCISSPEHLLDDLPNVEPTHWHTLNNADNFKFSEPCQQTPSCRATVEDENDDNENNPMTKSTHIRYIESFPGLTGEALRQEKTRFEVLQQIQEMDAKAPWEPFASRAEWGLAEWLMRNVGQKSMNEYLQLPIVS